MKKYLYILTSIFILSHLQMYSQNVAPAQAPLFPAWFQFPTQDDVASNAGTPVVPGGTHNLHPHSNQA